MAVVLVEGVCQAKCTGQVGTQPWNVIVYFGGPSTTVWTGAQLTALANALIGGMSSWWNATNMDSETTFTQVEAVDLGVSAPAVGISSHAALAGTSASQNDAASSVMVNYSIAARYRGGHPRSYLPGMAAVNQIDAQHWAMTAFNNYVAAWEASLTAAAAAAVTAGVSPCQQVVPTYNYEYTDMPSKKKYFRERTSLKFVYPVLSVSAVNRIRSQRRRLGK